MRTYYEHSRDESKLVHLSRSRSHVYPSHYHQSLEVYILRRGSCRLEINGRVADLSGGTVVVIDSYDIHHYISWGEGSDDCAIVIPYRYLDRFNRERGAKALADNYILNSALADELLDLADRYIRRGSEDAVTEAGISLFLSVLLSRVALSDSPPRGESGLVRQILDYIGDNFRGDISRSRIAAELGYTDSHISRVFHRYLGRGICDYVAELRLDYIDRMIKEGDPRSQTELIYDAGFGSPESYYRWRKKLAER